MAVSVAFLKVMNMLEPPNTLLRPAVGCRVLWGNLRPRPARQPDYEPTAAFTETSVG